MFNLEVLKLINKLCENGYEAYLIGGVVRDYLLNVPCHDYDVATSATPDKIKEVYKDYPIFSYGEKFGTIGIRYNEYLIEITTFRKEDSYTDNRHPEIINFDANLENDCKRRDFTINAIAYDVKNEKIVDLVGGVDDLKKGIIRTVGDANQRFCEDSLRILRAIRFSARLNFVIEEKTKEAIFKDYKLLANISKERITEEISKILLGGAENIIQDYYFLFDYLIPGLEGVNLGLLKIKTNNLVFKLAIIFSEVRDLNKAINSFKFPKAINNQVRLLVENADLELNDDLVNARLLLHKFGKSYYICLNDYRKLIGLPYTSNDTLDKAINMGFENKDLAVNGRNIKTYTLFDGQQISECLEEVFNLVARGKLANNKEVIKEYLFNKYGKQNYLNKRIIVIKKIDDVFQKNDAIFSIGASCMMYFRGIIDFFNDLDISVSKDNYLKVKEDLEKLSKPVKKKWGYIYNLNIDGIDIDLVIKEDNVLNNCDMVYNLDNHALNLESIDYWLARYTELERFNRVEQIKKYKGAK